jgi:hypothetical protein
MSAQSARRGQVSWEAAVTNRGFGDDGTIDDLPWASVFDPAANARALSAIQAEGFRAASRIVDRFVRAVGNGDDEQADARPSGAEDGVPGLQDLERLTRAWWLGVGQLLLRSTPAAGRQDGQPVTLDIGDGADGGAARGAVRLECAVGGTAAAEIWLHNRGSEDRGDVRLRCSDLLGHDGDTVDADAVHFDAPIVPMPRRSSRGVTIAVDVAPGVLPGIYRGTLLASGHPDLWLPVVLTVRLPGE